MSERDEDTMAESQQKNLTNVLNAKLEVRVTAIRNIALALLNIDHEVIKPGLQKRMLRSIISACVDGQYVEKAWLHTCYESLADLAEKQSQVQIGCYIFEFLNDARGHWQGSGARKSVISLCVHILSSVGRNCISCDLPGWFDCYVRLIGEAIEGGKSEVVDKAVKSNEKIRTVLAGLWSECSSLVPLFVHIWEEAAFLIPMSYLACYIENKVDKFPQFSYVKGSIIHAIIKRVLGAKQPISYVDLASLRPFLTILSTADWKTAISSHQAMEGSSSTVTAADAGSESLEAAAIRTMKKAPEGSAVTVATLVSHVSVNLSDFVRLGAASTGLRLLKSTSSDVRRNGLILFKSMSSHCMDAGAATLIVRTLLDALQGKGGALTQQYQRVVVLAALTDCANSIAHLGREVAVEMMAEISGPLVACVDKEVDDGCKHLGVSCLGERNRVRARQTGVFMK